MADESEYAEGWLAPRAPGAAEPPRFHAPPPSEQEPAPAADENLWAPPQPQPPRQPAGQADSGWSPPQGGQPRSVFVQPHPASGNGLAIASLVLGIAGLAFLVFSVGLGFAISLPCSIGAWVCASVARGRIAEGRAAGASQAKAGLILGILGVALAAVALVTWMVLIGADVVDLEEWQRNLEQELERQRDGGDDRGRARLSALRALLP
jgi:hypothetical protein